MLNVVLKTINTASLFHTQNLTVHIAALLSLYNCDLETLVAKSESEDRLFIPKSIFQPCIVYSVRFYYVRVVFQNQIQAQQAIYVKQQQHQMAPQQGEFFKANDSMSALPTNFSDLAMNKEPQVSTAVQDPIVPQRVVLKLFCFTQYCSQKPMLGITYEIISCIELYHKYPLYKFSPSRLGNMYFAMFFSSSFD